MVFLADIPTPYIVALLESLAELLDLTVVFGAARGSRGMDWDIGTPSFRHTVVGGLVIRRARTRAPDVYVDPRIFLQLIRERPEVIITTAFSMPTVFAALHGAAAGSRMLIYSDGTSVSEHAIRAPQRLARRLLIGRTAGCVGSSTDAVARFEELGCPRSKLFLAPHSTPLASMRRVAGERQPSPPGRLRVLTVSRLIPRKGIDCAIRAVGVAAGAQPGITLDVVGAGPEEDRLRKLASECAPDTVRFHGFVDQPDLPTRFREADAFAFPSRMDQFGIAALQAASAGLPLVASPYAGATADLVTHGVSGLVIDPDDIGALAEGLLRLARDVDLRLAMGVAAAKRTEGHEPAAAARVYATAVDHALAGRRRDPQRVGRRPPHA